MDGGHGLSWGGHGCGNRAELSWWGGGHWGGGRSGEDGSVTLWGAVSMHGVPKGGGQHAVSHRGRCLPCNTEHSGSPVGPSLPPPPRGEGGITMQPHARCCVHNAQSTRTRLCQAPPPQNALLPQQLLPHSRGKTPHQALGGGQALPGGCKALLLYWMGSRWVQDGRGLPA